MYSLKNQYKHLLKENISKSPSSIDIANSDILVGKLSSQALELFNLKDGSGGRGEYSTIYDILVEGSKFNNIENTSSIFSNLLSSVRQNRESLKEISKKKSPYDYSGGKKITLAAKQALVEDFIVSRDNSEILKIFTDRAWNDYFTVSGNEIDTILFDKTSFLNEIRNLSNENVCEKLSNMLNKEVWRVDFVPLDNIEPGMSVHDMLINNVELKNVFYKGREALNPAGRSIPSVEGKDILAKIEFVFTYRALTVFMLHKNKELITTLEALIKGENIDYNADYAFNYAMLSSVTSSGTESKSTDLIINTNHYKGIFAYKPPIKYFILPDLVFNFLLHYTYSK